MGERLGVRLKVAGMTCDGCARHVRDALARFYLRVEGMTCPRCQARVAAALRAVAGVRRARVSWRRGLALVRAEEGVEVQHLVRAIQRGAVGTQHRYAVTEVRRCSSAREA